MELWYDVLGLFRYYHHSSTYEESDLVVKEKLTPQLKRQ